MEFFIDHISRDKTSQFKEPPKESSKAQSAAPPVKVCPNYTHNLRENKLQALMDNCLIENQGRRHGGVEGLLSPGMGMVRE